MKDNIIFFHNGAELYGGSKSLLSIINVLGNNYNVRVILPESGPLEKRLKKQKIHVDVIKSYPIISIQNLKSISLLLRFIFDLIKSIYEVRVILKKFRPSIIHTNTSTIITSSLIAKIYSIPHVWHIREIYDGHQKYLWWYYQKFINLFSDVIIANSKATALQFQNKKKIKIIYNVLMDNKNKGISTRPLVSFKKNFNVEKNICVGMVGRINLQRKGQSILVNAASHLKSKYPDVKYFIIGEPYPGKEYYLNELKKLIDDKKLNDQFILTGELVDIHSVINSMDIMVIPSNRPESFGNVVSESMVNGKPVIISNIGGAPEQIVKNKTGLIFKNEDHYDLSKKLDILLQNKNMRTRFGQDGKKLYMNRFNNKIFKNKITRTYNNILGFNGS